MAAFWGMGNEMGRVEDFLCENLLRIRENNVTEFAFHLTRDRNNRV